MGRSDPVSTARIRTSGSTGQVTKMAAPSEPAPAPTRNERKACWSHRDSYFACLTQKGVTVPPGTDMSDGRGPVGKAAKEEQERLEREKKQTVEEARKQDPCLAERQGYETNCARSWVSTEADSRLASSLSERCRREHAPDLDCRLSLWPSSLSHRSTTSTRDECLRNVRE